jgi:predicted transcriptional regulator
MPKAMTVRLDDETAVLLTLVANIRGTSITEEIRGAIETRLEALRDDPDFRTTVLDRLETQSRLIRRLAE